MRRRSACTRSNPKSTEKSLLNIFSGLFLTSYLSDKYDFRGTALPISEPYRFFLLKKYKKIHNISNYLKN